MKDIFTLIIIISGMYCLNVLVSYAYARWMTGMDAKAADEYISERFGFE